MKYVDNDINFENKDQFLEHIIDKYYGEVLMFIIKSVRDSADAEDLAQETFFSFYDSLDRFRYEASIKNYIYRIAVNKIINHENKKKREKNKIISFFTSRKNMEIHGKNDLSNSLEKKELRDIIKISLDKFPPKQRVILSMRLFRDLKIREIAEIIQTSEGNVKAQLSTGLKKIQEALKEYGYGLQ